MCDRTEQKNNKPATPIPPQPLSCASVIGITFDKGVILAADSLVSYEGLAMFTDVQRIFKVNDALILGGGGISYKDFQYIQGVVEDREREVQSICPLELKNFLRTGFYNRSIRGNPLQVDLVLAGIQDGVPYLVQLDQRGSIIEDHVVATGFARRIVLPFLNNELAKRGNTVDEHEARELIKRSTEILYRRHSLAHNTLYVGVAYDYGSKIEKISL